MSDKESRPIEVCARDLINPQTGLDGGQRRKEARKIYKEAKSAMDVEVAKQVASHNKFTLSNPGVAELYDELKSLLNTLKLGGVCVRQK